MSGILGIKVGMTQVFTPQGERVPVTLVSTEGCVVVQTKTKEKEGVQSVQLGIGEKSVRDLSKSLKKHFEKAKVKPTRWLRDFQVAELEKYPVGSPVSLDFLKPGDKVEVRGETKGRGFSGVIKRWGFSGGPGGHGSRFHRHGGAIGNKTFPKRIFKKRRMAGHYGTETRTVNVQCVDVLKDEHLLVLKGQLPGSKNSLVEVRLSHRG